MTLSLSGKGVPSLHAARRFHTSVSTRLEETAMTPFDARCFAEEAQHTGVAEFDGLRWDVKGRLHGWASELS
jgi:hypothetical protein